mgnify:CR=1 FL=1|jgi:histidyl-tRNA synthetase
MELKAPRGTYDILPAEAQKWQYIEQIMRQTAASFGFQEIRTPIFEHTELFQRGVGETTDIVTKEMYSFQDKSRRSLTLRPEGTASCVRSLIEHRLYGGVMPVKWYYQGPMFRYDRPQAGRYRQFHQFGVEVFGSSDPLLDAEVIILMLEILSRLGLTEYELHLNSVGCPACRQVYRKKLIAHLAPQVDKLCKDCQKRYEQNPLRVLDCKEAGCQEATVGFPVIMDSLCLECQEHYGAVKKALSSAGVSYLHDDRLVRGLDYYTKTAFEVHIPGIGAQSAIGGGGRYDGLVKECGGPEIPGIGFALGIERILLILEQKNRLPAPAAACDVFVVAMDPAYAGSAFELLLELRRAGLRADQDYNRRSPKAQMKHADRMGASLVLFIGEEEMEKQTVTVRKMKDSRQLSVSRAEILENIISLLAID